MALVVYSIGRILEAGKNRKEFTPSVVLMVLYPHYSDLMSKGQPCPTSSEGLASKCS